MTWATLPPRDPYGEYHGIHVGFRHIGMGASMKKELAARGWGYVEIQYDADTNMIRFVQSEQYKGYKVTQHGSITAQITKIMPEGRYVCFDGSSPYEMLFSYIG